MYEVQSDGLPSTLSPSKTRPSPCGGDGKCVATFQTFGMGPGWGHFLAKDPPPMTHRSNNTAINDHQRDEQRGVLDLERTGEGTRGRSGKSNHYSSQLQKVQSGRYAHGASKRESTHPSY
eukprot:scaffold884_cov322-Pavlova_lutheri.AAC.10